MKKFFIYLVMIAVFLASQQHVRAENDGQETIEAYQLADFELSLVQEEQHSVKKIIFSAITEKDAYTSDTQQNVLSPSPPTPAILSGDDHSGVPSTPIPLSRLFFLLVLGLVVLLGVRSVHFR